MRKGTKILASVCLVFILGMMLPIIASPQYQGIEIIPDIYTVILDHFNGSTVGFEVIGTLNYVQSIPIMDLAGDFPIGTYIIYRLTASLVSQGTVELWLNPRVYNKKFVNINWYYTHSYPGAGHVLHLRLLEDGRIMYYGWPSPYNLCSQSVIPLNEWTHFALSWGPDGTKIYVNGELDASVSYPIQPHAYSGNWVYLSDWGSSDFGYIDEFHISMIQRTDEEIRSSVMQQVFVYVDVKPGSCPNPLNVESKGVLPVVVLGTEDFDVTDIIPESVLLTREGYESTGVAPLRWSYEDVATPFDGEPCDCHDLNGDGYSDLTLKFKIQELMGTLELDMLDNGETIPLILTGNLYESNMAIRGSDCVRIKK